jgi:hypothetical protein
MEFQHVTIKANSRKELDNECTNFGLLGYRLLSRSFYVQWPRFWRVIWIAEMDNNPMYQLKVPTPQQDTTAPLVCDDEKLNKALKEENYEEAARIRDRLKKQIRK